MIKNIPKPPGGGLLFPGFVLKSVRQCELAHSVSAMFLDVPTFWISPTTFGLSIIISGH
jgi:hypothetical protein